MNTIKRDVYVLRDTIKIPIEVTKGTDMVGFEFAVRDYSIPGTAAAVTYVYHKSMEKPKGILCDINDSTISFTPDNNFFAVGMNELQIRVINNGKSLISFKEKIKCSDAMGFPDDEEESQQTLVEQLLTKVGKEEGDRKTADDTEREERIAADDAEKKARIAEENARAEADEAIRANRIVTLDEIDLVTEEGFFVDALAVKELNSNLVKTAVYMNNGAYNIAPSNSEFQGTDFSKKILDNIGLVHNYDATNYKHTFTVPQDGIYLIHAYMNFQQGVAKQLSLYAKLERNNVEQSRQSKLIGPYSGADFMFLNEINAGDKIRFTVLQNSGSVIQVSGGCRLNIIRMGK